MAHHNKALEGKVAVITGAGRGIGAATARLFAIEGAKVVLASRTAGEINQVAETIRASGGQALAVSTDVTSEASVQALFNEALKSFGRVDILINNAGSVIVKDFAAFTAEAWDSVISTNLRGSFLCARELFRHVKTTPHAASIVNLSSLGGIRGTEKFKGMSAYVVAKHGVVGLTESLAVEGRELGVRVNCVAPGAVDTQMLREAAPFLKTKTTPDDVARTILFLSDDRQASPLNGAIIEIHSNL